MDDFKFIVDPAPHAAKIDETSKIMYWVIGALMPVTIFAVYLMGIPALTVIAVSVIGAVGTEAAIQKLSKKPITILDGSAAVTGLLLALTMPPKVPWWMPLFGAFIAICIAKVLFGGLGYNIFNPALVARAILLLSWPAQMTKAWFDYNPQMPDAVTKATPLYQAKTAMKAGQVFQAGNFYKSYLISNNASSIGEISVVLLLIGAGILLVKKIIDWRIPFIYIGTVAFLTFIAGGDPLFYVLAGGLMLGAFFMATDYVTSPITPNGKIVYGLGLGAATVLMRFYTGLPEGVMFSILFMNMFAPLIEKYTRPRVMGSPKRFKGTK